MLCFKALPESLPDPGGLVLFPDHRDGAVLYYLPPGMDLAPAANGDPDFFLLRYHGDFALAAGGLLRFRVRFSAAPDAIHQAFAAAGYELRQTGFSSGRFRLRLRSLQEGGSDETGDWRPLTLSSDAVSVPAVSLTPRETQFLEALLNDGVSAVEMDSEMLYAGVAPGAPWLVTVDTARLRQLLSALLPDPSAPADRIVAAFLSLPDDEASPVAWRPLEEGAPALPRDTMLTETALRSLALLFDADPDEDPFAARSYHLRAPSAAEASQLAIDLTPPRWREETCRLTWSFTTLYQSLDTPEKKQRLFPPVNDVSPFANVDVSVINRLPYDRRYLRKATVDLRYSGAGGVPQFKSCTFDGTSELYRFNVEYPAAVGDFDLAYRLTTFLAAPGGSGWPVVHKSDFAKAEGPVVEVSRQAAAMDFVSIEAESEVFEKAAWVSASIYRYDVPRNGSPGGSGAVLADLRLDAGQPRAWIALPAVAPADKLGARLIAHAPGEPEPAPFPIADAAIANRRVSVAAWQLEVLDPDNVTVRVDPAAAPRFALLNVTLATLGEEGRTFPLDADSPIRWSVFRNSVFEPLHYRYRLAYALLDVDGQARPLTSTDWITAQETELVVGLPEPL